MRNLIIIFILLFSLPAFTSDDLSGNKIFCSYKLDNELRLVGFHFTGRKVVNVYHEFKHKPLSIIGRTYETSSREIHIYDISRYEIANIDRQTLFSKHTLDGITYYYKDCKLIDGNIVAAFNEELKELKKLNKI